MAVNDDGGAPPHALAFDTDNDKAGSSISAPWTTASKRVRRPRRLFRKTWLWLGAAAAVAGAGVFVASQAAEKLVEMRYRIQLLEVRQESLARVAAATVKREQSVRGPAQLNTAAPFPFTEGEWVKIGGAEMVAGWPKDYTRTKAIAVHRDQLYAGLSNPGRGTPQVWRNDGERWERVGSAETVAKWSRFNEVSALASDGTTLFAAIDDTIWAFDAARGWRQIAGDGQAGSWASRTYSSSYALALNRGRLFVGMMGGPDAAVFAYTAGQ